jgi:transcriptional regulator with XRE-family HTH domain
MRKSLILKEIQKMLKMPAKPPDTAFYPRLDALCVQNGLSPGGLAEKIGLSNAAAPSWKRGAIPNGDTLIKMARELKTTTDYILMGAPPSPELTSQEQELLMIFRTQGVRGQTEILSCAYALLSGGTGPAQNYATEEYPHGRAATGSLLLTEPKCYVEGTVRLYKAINGAIRRKHLFYEEYLHYFLSKQGLDTSLPELLRDGISWKELNNYNKELRAITEHLRIPAEDIDMYASLSRPWDGAVVVDDRGRVIDYIENRNIGALATIGETPTADSDVKEKGKSESLAS